MNGNIIKFDQDCSFNFEHQFMYYDMAISQCGDAVHAAMKNTSFTRAKI